MYAGKGIAPWAGKRIICIGDYAEDYPVGFLTKQEEVDLANVNLYEYAHGFGCPLKLFHPYNYGKISMGYYERAYYSVEKSPIGSRLLDELLPKNQPIYPKESDCILLNLTTNEYVCASKIPDSHSRVFGLGHIVLLQTCWSSDYSMSIRHSVVDLHRGPWAGHCFKITSIEDIDSNSTDVSKAVIRKIAQVFDEDRVIDPA
ncbi:hypothetical protein GGI25_005236 [Coemansia spiralis]|uniref:Uncharacterized protein n=2 Tax=Coemansia TaxID=4863 RepID=A0A9W8G4Y9_9FUNG|nr:hypothetical protein EDC05_005106 [Coemansia umbellata]KAJ2619807.1 hypothetical protein GGI26_005523 [Coemansia sp. RSA 1358]KAJ2672163.1 hypothetical protein GGI25_005236 [Coemansia spiralis]